MFGDSDDFSGNGDGFYDNNGGLNYHLPVEGSSAAGGREEGLGVTRGLGGMQLCSVYHNLPRAWSNRDAGVHRGDIPCRLDWWSWQLSGL